MARIKKNRLPEVFWNTLRDKKGNRQIGEPVPVIREYMKNGRLIKVYAPAVSVDLIGQGNTAKGGNASFKNIIYPAV